MLQIIFSHVDYFYNVMFQAKGTKSFKNLHYFSEEEEQ